MNFTKDKWNEIDPEKSDTWPDHEQEVDYMFNGHKWSGYFITSEQEWGTEGTFCSNGGYCDWYDVTLWRPRAAS